MKLEILDCTLRDGAHVNKGCFGKENIIQIVKDLVKAITPVPGGVGPMTISCLLNNTVKAYKKINSI